MVAAGCGDHLDFDVTPLDSGFDAGQADMGRVDTGVDVARFDVRDVAIVDASEAGGDASADVTDVTDASDVTAIDATDAHDGAATADVSDVPVATDVHDASTVTDVAPAPWRHTITIDGINDFTAASEQFATTSTAAGYHAYVTWDAMNLYVGYDGPDIASGDMNKWVFVYLDTDPGAGTGATTGVRYNTEAPGMPTGFGAEFYFRWKASNTFQTLEVFGGGAWSTVATAVIATHETGTFVEFAIPLASIGSPARVGVMSLMMNETVSLEASYAGIYASNFADGYFATVPTTTYLRADFASSLAPNDASNRRP